MFTRRLDADRHAGGMRRTEAREILGPGGVTRRESARTIVGRVPAEGARDAEYPGEPQVLRRVAVKREPARLPGIGIDPNERVIEIALVQVRQVQPGVVDAAVRCLKAEDIEVM